MSRNLGTRAACLLTLLTLASAGCGPREPRTDTEKLARGRELIQQMSDGLAAAKTFSVATVETRERMRGAKLVKLSFSREGTVHKPDRFYFKDTGDVAAEGWYDGKHLTIAAHKERVFAQARMPDTLDRTLDAMSERYGFPLVMADLAYSSPAKALLTDTTKGGYVGREDVEGTPCTTSPSRTRV
jgi:hypothetical protein